MAFAVVHERVDGLPICTEAGEAVRVQVGAVGGGGAAVTVTAAAQVTEPPDPVAVPVYVVVVAVGETDFEPEATGVTEPMP